MGQTVIGLFEYVDTMLAVASRLRQSSDVKDVSVLSSVPICEEVEHTLGERKDPVRYFSFAGAVAGLFGGAILTIGTAVLYVLPRGGRPIISIPPTLIISYETLILGGVLATLAGFIITARLIICKDEPYHDRISEDRFGLMVNVEPERVEEVERILSEGGAEEVKRF